MSKYSEMLDVSDFIKSVDRKSVRAFMKSGKGVIKGGRNKFDALTSNKRTSKGYMYKVGKSAKISTKKIVLTLYSGKNGIPADNFELIPNVSQTSGNYSGIVGFKLTDYSKPQFVKRGFIWDGKLFQRSGKERLPIERVFVKPTGELMDMNKTNVADEMKNLFAQNLENNLKKI